MNINHRGVPFLAALTIAGIGGRAPRYAVFFDHQDVTVDPKVVEQISTEVKKLGDNVKEVKDSLGRDLESVRKLAEEGKASVTEIAALKESVLQKHKAMDDLSTTVTSVAEQVKKTVERLDDVQKKLQRPGAPQESPDEEATRRKNAITFYRTSLAVRGQLKAIEFDEKQVDFEGIELWRTKFANYLRIGDRDPRMEAKALSVGSDPDGGYLVPSEVSNRIITRVYETSPLRQLATVETIGTDALEIPTDFEEATFGWIGETTAPVETATPRIGIRRIVVHEMYAKPRATQKILEDAARDVEAWLAEKVSQKFGRGEATAFITGNGVTRPRGLFTYPAGTAEGQVEQIPSLGATAMTADGIINTVFALKGDYIANAVWLMKRASVGGVMTLKDTTGQYLWRPGLEGGPGRNPMSLAGYPIWQADDVAAVGAGALAAAFGDFRQAYTIVDRLGITTMRDPFSAKPFVEFYSRKRVGGDVVNFEAYKIMKIAAS